MSDFTSLPLVTVRVSQMAQWVKNLPAMQETWVQSLGSEDLQEEENGNPLSYSCLRNSMDRGAWQATVQRVAKRQTWLSGYAHTRVTG